MRARDIRTLHYQQRTMNFQGTCSEARVRARTLENGRWTILATHAGNEIVRAEPFADIDIELGSLWADAEG